VIPEARKPWKREANHMKRVCQRAQSPEKIELTRRKLLAGAGKIAAGAALATAGGFSLASMASAKSTYPWPYKKINPQKAGEIAYKNWYKGFCCYASASGILIPLQKMVGEPYASLPIEAFTFGHGGTVGWGTLCGTLLGAGLASSFAAGKDGEKIINDVIQWYTTTGLPLFKPAEPKASIKNINRSDSPLCHVSVGKWMDKEGVAFFTPERKDRCARLSADVSMKTVMLLNDWSDGKYKPSHGSQVKAHDLPAQNNCDGCHG
jgi:hypothetical protein